MIIGVIGLGYVGLTLGIIAASRGIQVYGLETNTDIKKKLKQNKTHFFEEGLEDLIAQYNNQTFHVVDEFPKNIKFDAFIVTVGTPLIGHDIKKPNFDYILSALSSISEIYNGSQMVILRSTVSVGTTSNFVLPRLAQMSGLDKSDVLLGMCPERTIEGKALIELTTLPQIISGNNQKSLQIAKSLFLKITPQIVEMQSFEEAELAKLYCNVYRDMTFAIGNAFCLVAQCFGVDGVKVINGANQGYPRSNIAKPGFVAGPCLEKDAHIMLNNIPECLAKNFIFSARTLNESLVDMVCAYIQRVLGAPNKDKIITISGLAFKGRPETSDLRGSAAVYIAQKLKHLGYTLYLHDFVAKKEDMESLNLGKYFPPEKLLDAVSDSKLLIILNNHLKYAALDYDPVFSSTRGLSVLDIWDVCATLKKYKDIHIDTIGTINLNERI